MTMSNISLQDRKIGDHAIVMGASIAGLLSARVLSDYFKNVTVIERDKLNDRPENRKGQPQAGHGHGILPSAMAILNRYFPGLGDAVNESGGVMADLGSSFIWYVLGGYRKPFESGLLITLASRANLEWQIRRRLLEIPNVSLLDEHRVVGLMTSEGKTGVSGVRAVNLRSNDTETEVRGELVVDALGRESGAPRWLEAMGYDAPQLNSVEVDFGCASRIYERQKGDLGGASMLVINPGPMPNLRCGLIFPIEGDRWVVTLAGWNGDHPQADDAGFLGYARSLPAPDLYDTIVDREPLTQIGVFKVPAVRRFRYDKLDSLPEGFLAVGDAVCSFNPTFGQGMASAVMQADVINTAIGQHRNIKGIGKDFFARTAKIIDVPWKLSTSGDFQFPGTRGKKPFGTDLLNAYFDRVQKATHRDVVVHEAFLKVMNLSAPPISLFKPGIVRRSLLGRKN